MFLSCWKIINCVCFTQWYKDKWCIVRPWRRRSRLAAFWTNLFYCDDFKLFFIRFKAFFYCTSKMWHMYKKSASKVFLNRACVSVANISLIAKHSKVGCRFNFAKGISYTQVLLLRRKPKCYCNLKHMEFKWEPMNLSISEALWKKLLLPIKLQASPCFSKCQARMLPSILKDIPWFLLLWCCFPPLKINLHITFLMCVWAPLRRISNVCMCVRRACRDCEKSYRD